MLKKIIFAPAGNQTAVVQPVVGHYPDEECGLYSDGPKVNINIFATAPER